MAKKKDFLSPVVFDYENWGEECKNNVPMKTGEDLLGQPDFMSTDPSKYQGYDGEYGLATKLKKGEGRARGVVTHVPETLFANNEVSGEGRKRSNNLFQWGRGSED